MDTLVLEGSARKPQERAQLVRVSGNIPAVYYGRGQKSLPLSVGYQKFKKVYEKAGENTIVELTVDGKKVPVLIYDVQYDPVSDRVAHIDFLHVDMTKEVTTTVKVNIVGTAPAVKNMAGVLDVLKHEIKIKCLPKDLIHAIDVDVSPIVDFNTTIHVSDLIFPKTIKVIDHGEDGVVTVTPPRAEEETKAAEAVPVEGVPPSGAPGAPGASGAEGQAPAAVAPSGGGAPSKEPKK